MTKLFTSQEFNNAKNSDLLPLKCEECGKTFYRKKNDIVYVENHPNGRVTYSFCSIQCNGKHKRKTKDYKKEIECLCKNCGKHFFVDTNRFNASKSGNHFCSKHCMHEYYKMFKENKIECICANCGKIIYKRPCEIVQSKTNNHFCSKSCAATYNNKHKTFGIRRSKLEKYLESKLSELYPDLEIKYNTKEEINSELDIYIPKYKIAFELNGIFHYEPIFGDDKLHKTQKNDDNKFQLCQKNNISLCVIDTSSLKRFKEQNAEKFFNIIKNIVNNYYKMSS